ncbi:MAG: polyprenol monophosphomannose synthase [Bacteroidales bacterium]|nr:polyprenol monophosphomannose synthase [Bacteroidales bacterium]NLM91504.1 polyprenol monophosphomannose synthase [Bacteroidales bacterium]
MAESLIIIPTYKEKENIEKMIRKVFSLPKDFHILVIDDNSPDGTADIVSELMPSFKDRLFLEVRKGKQGLGTAYIHGFKWALERDYQYVFEMDADFSHNPEDLLRLHEACAVDGYDLAIGSRYINGVNVVNWPMGRVLMSYYASAYVRLITGMGIRDTTAGFKCYRREVLQAINLNKIQFTGYAFQIEMKFLAWKMGFKIKEISIIFMDRSEGVSKMSKGIFKEAVLGVIKLRWQSFFRTYERKA